MQPQQLLEPCPHLPGRGWRGDHGRKPHDLTIRSQRYRRRARPGVAAMSWTERLTERAITFAIAESDEDL
jgi:hypothetical protein